MRSLVRLLPVVAFLFLLCGNGSAQRHVVPDAIHRAFVQLSLAGQVSTRAALLQMLIKLQFGDLARIVEGIQIDSKQGPRWFLAELEVAMGFKGWSGDVREPERLWNCLARVLRVRIPPAGESANGPEQAESASGDGAGSARVMFPLIAALATGSVTTLGLVCTLVWFRRRRYVQRPAERPWRWKPGKELISAVARVLDPPTAHMVLRDVYRRVESTMPEEEFPAPDGLASVVWWARTFRILEREPRVLAELLQDEHLSRLPARAEKLRIMTLNYLERRPPRRSA